MTHNNNKIVCPKHKIPLEVNDRLIEVFNQPYVCTTGRCLKCKPTYINRKLFASSSSFSINETTYCFDEDLSKAYPAVNDMDATKRLLSERDRAENERRRIANLERAFEIGMHKTISIEHLYLKQHLPQQCPRDNQRLLNAQNVTISYKNIKAKIKGYYCPVCSTIYASPDQKTKLIEAQKRAERRKEQSQRAELNRPKKPRPQAYTPNLEKAKDCYTSTKGGSVHMITVEKKSKYVPPAARVKIFQGGACTPK